MPYAVCRIPYTVYRIPYTVYRIPYTVNFLLYHILFYLKILIRNLSVILQPFPANLTHTSIYITKNIAEMIVKRSFPFKSMIIKGRTTFIRKIPSTQVASLKESFLCFRLNSFRAIFSHDLINTHVSNSHFLHAKKG